MPPDAASHEPGGGLERGLVAAEVAEEFPGLGLSWALVEHGSGRTSRALRDRLAILSNRFAGPQAIELRQQPIPWAYRVFFRHIGLDPDTQRTPVEERALERLQHGGFKPNNLLDDALTIAIMESGVALQAFDADRVRTPLGIRPSRPGEALDGRPGALPDGTLVIADALEPVGLLFGAVGSGRGVSKRTSRMVIVALQVAGVPDIAVEEAMWLCLEALQDG